MIILSSQNIDFSAEHKRVLQELTIRESSPGTILRDFEALLDYLSEKAVFRLPANINCRSGCYQRSMPSCHYDSFDVSRVDL